jgi:hypothetical protein
MTRRFMVAAALAFPLLFMAMSDMLPFDVNHWIDALGPGSDCRRSRT